MIIFIATVLITVVSFVIFDKTTSSIAEGVTLIGWVIGLVCSIAMALLILCAHIGVNATIEKNRIEYESLCKRNEIITSNYEDVSKSDIIKDVAEWNKMVYSTKYWTYNPWTNWFFSKRVADNLEMIE